MAKTITTKFDVAEHLRSPEEMAAYLDAYLEESHGDATSFSTILRVISVLGFKLHAEAATSHNA